LCCLCRSSRPTRSSLVKEKTKAHEREPHPHTADSCCALCSVITSACNAVCLPPRSLFLYFYHSSCVLRTRRVHSRPSLMSELNSAEAIKRALASPTPSACPVSIGSTCAKLPYGGPFMLSKCSSNAIVETPDKRGWPAPASPKQKELWDRIRYGGLLDSIDLIDNTAFGISPAEAMCMDPQQRLLLESGCEAFHLAGSPQASLEGAPYGVFIGITDVGKLSTHGVYDATGKSIAVASGRISYFLGLHGPCVSYDTACSSTLIAAHAALYELRLDECKKALLSGVNLLVSSAISFDLASAGMTSSFGRCCVFDARADGYVRGEACVSITLLTGLESPLSHVEIAGSAIRQDGKRASLTTPNGLAQEALYLRALVRSGVDATEISSVEAAANASPLGDPIEAGSIHSALLRAGSRTAPLIAHNIKGSVGHSEPASGATALLKSVAELSCAWVAPNAQLRILSAGMDAVVHGTACVLPMQDLAGTASSCSGISSFGFSGTTAHAVARSTGSRTLRAVALPEKHSVRLRFQRSRFPVLQSSVSASLGPTASQAQPLTSISELCAAFHQVTGTKVTPGTRISSLNLNSLQQTSLAQTVPGFSKVVHALRSDPTVQELMDLMSDSAEAAQPEMFLDALSGVRLLCMLDVIRFHARAGTCGDDPFASRSVLFVFCSVTALMAGLSPGTSALGRLFGLIKVLFPPYIIAVLLILPTWWLRCPSWFLNWKREEIITDFLLLEGAWPKNIVSVPNLYTLWTFTSVIMFMPLAGVFEYLAAKLIAVLTPAAAKFSELQGFIRAVLVACILTFPSMPHWVALFGEEKIKEEFWFLGGYSLGRVYHFAPLWMIYYFIGSLLYQGTTVPLTVEQVKVLMWATDFSFLALVISGATQYEHLTDTYAPFLYVIWLFGLVRTNSTYIYHMFCQLGKLDVGGTLALNAWVVHAPVIYLCRYFFQNDHRCINQAFCPAAAPPSNLTFWSAYVLSLLVAWGISLGVLALREKMKSISFPRFAEML
jgi:3-oxoacyl-(acyl-carrier-protein) synthase